MRAGALVLMAAAGLSACRSNETWPFAVGESEGTVLVTERPEAAGRLRNATNAYGVFFVERKCLQVRVEDEVFTPVLPAGTTLAEGGTAMLVGGRRLATGVRYSLPFASEVGTKPGAAAKAIGVPDECSQRLMSMGAPA
jgi:hypothetical protein